MGQIVTADIVRNLTPGLKTTFMQGWSQVELPYKQVVTDVPSTLPTETYGWLGQVPTVRQWTDERIPKGLTEYGYTIKNNKYEVSIKVDLEALEDEQYGQIKLRISQMPQAVARHQNKLVFDLFNNGNSTLCYDGANFFSASHSEGNSGTQSNLLSSQALAAGTYATARANMAGFKDDQGQIVGAHGTLLVVPPALEGTARTILNADFVSDGAGAGVTNVWKGSADLLVVPWLTSSTSWFLLDLSEYIKPIVFQTRVAPEFKALDATSDSDTVFMRDAVMYGVRARYNAGYGDWRTAVGNF